MQYRSLLVLGLAASSAAAFTGGARAPPKKAPAKKAPVKKAPVKKFKPKPASGGTFAYGLPGNFNIVGGGEAVLGGGLLQCGLRRLEASAPVCGAMLRANVTCDPNASGLTVWCCAE